MAEKDVFAVFQKLGRIFVSFIFYRRKYFPINYSAYHVEKSHVSRINSD